MNDALEWAAQIEWIWSAKPTPVPRKFTIMKSRFGDGVITIGSKYERDDGIWLDVVPIGQTLTERQINHLVDWSTNHLSETARVYYDWMIFANHDDAFAFKMRWSGVKVNDLCKT